MGFMPYYYVLLFGASVLDGGFAAWSALGLAVQTGARPTPLSSDQIPLVQIDREVIIDIEELLARLHDPDVVIVDVRSPPEYKGLDVRAARGGHIPGAVNIDWEDSLDIERDDRLLPDEVLRSLFWSHGVTPDKEVIVYCQTHHRSSHTYAVLNHLGYPRVRAYAGSWAQWGNRNDTPIESNVDLVLHK